MGHFDLGSSADFTLPYLYVTKVGYSLFSIFCFFFLFFNVSFPPQNITNKKCFPLINYAKRLMPRGDGQYQSQFKLECNNSVTSCNVCTYLPALSLKVKTDTTQWDSCFELFIAVVRRRPREGKPRPREGEIRATEQSDEARRDQRRDGTWPEGDQTEFPWGSRPI